MNFITLTEAKEYLRVDSSDEDAVVASLLAAARTTSLQALATCGVLASSSGEFSCLRARATS